VQAALVPLHVRGAQAGFPADATGRIVHEPSAVAPIDATHTLHAPTQAELQQIPPTQKPDTQSVGCAQVPPLAASNSSAL
jgi:hypothetical protein